MFPIKMKTAALSVYLQLSFLNVKYQAVVEVMRFPRALDGRIPSQSSGSFLHASCHKRELPMAGNSGRNKITLSLKGADTSTRKTEKGYRL